jgi:hypothetical protein
MPRVADAGGRLAIWAPTVQRGLTAMAEPAQPTPPNGSKLDPPFLPPAELPAVQLWHPKKPQRKLAPWHWVALIIGVPIVATLTAIGAYTTASWAFNDPPAVIKLATAKPTPTHHTQPPTPTYDIAGYKSAVSGSDEQAFVTALNRLRHDIRGLKFEAVTTDALNLSTAANTYLTDLRKTNPPPAYGPAKLANMAAAVYARQAASTIQGAITSSDLGALQTGLSQANKAKEALSQAVAAMPKGS